MYRIENGQYVFELDGKVLFTTPEVALAFDKQSGTLLKHGTPDRVREWVDQARGKLQNIGFDEMAAAMVIFFGNFEVEEVNACLTTTGYFEKFVRDLQVTFLSESQPV